LIFAVYIVIIALLLYIFGERDIIDNFSLAMSTVSTGGFVPSSTILQDMLVEEYIVLMGAMILGALPFTFHYAFVRKRFLSPKLGKEVLVFFAILAGAILIFSLVSGLDPIRSVFYPISAGTTAGLQIESLDGLSGASQTILVLLMFIGGCGFSTAGGIKIFRLLQLKNIGKALRTATRKELSDENKKEILTAIISNLPNIIKKLMTILVVGFTSFVITSAQSPPVVIIPVASTNASLNSAPVTSAR